MTEQQAEKTANILIGAAALATAYYIVRTPSLRRMARQLARTAIMTSGPAWLLAEVQRGWQSGAEPPARRAERQQAI